MILVLFIEENEYLGSVKVGTKAESTTGRVHDAVLNLRSLTAEERYRNTEERYLGNDFHLEILILLRESLSWRAFEPLPIFNVSFLEDAFLNMAIPCQVFYHPPTPHPFVQAFSNPSIINRTSQPIAIFAL